ncbi:MAG: preprotein translocase subunit SecE [Phycisphaeraceae bacterium]|nr:preprotein translocase subunit SecE [Phycisphaeraceae bacterium]
MALAMYKPGQGYWTRVMTAVFAGVLVMAAAAWLYQQALLVPLPERAWSASYRVAADFAQGQRVELLGESATGERPVLGTATVERVEASVGSGTVTMASPQMVGSAGRIQVQALRSQSGQVVAVNGGVLGVPVIDRIYVQGGFVLVTVLFGAFLIVYFVAIKKGSVDFLIATDGEMRKVNWSTRKDVLNSTWVVIGASALLGLFLFGFDSVFASFFDLIGVLDI